MVMQNSSSNRLDVKGVLDYLENNEDQYLDELRDFIAFRSISTKSEHQRDLDHCAAWIARHLKRIGMKRTEIFPTAGNPIVFSQWSGASNAPTILLYGHYDVQPPEPIEMWDSPPFEATMRRGNLYGRGTADDKGQVFIHLKVLEAYLHLTGRLPVNVKVIIEGEEEIGSASLIRFVRQHRKLLQADLAVVSDTAFFAEGVPSIVCGLRGIVYVEMEIVGPNRDLHSGAFGGTIQNPINVLARMITRLQNEKGRVTIPHFYDDVLPASKQERKVYEKLPWNDARYAKNLGVNALFGEKGYTTLERLWIRPTMDCCGIWGGYTGEGLKTVLPSRASAKISMRLVPDQRPERIAALIETYLKKIAPKGIRLSVKLLGTAEPALTSPKNPGIKAAAAALEKGFGKPALFQREGGSIPIVTHFKRLLGIETVLLGFGVPNENAHAPNEFIKLNHFGGGMKSVAHFYRNLPEYFVKEEGS